MVDTLTILFAVGAGAFGVAAIGVSGWGTLLWWRRRENPSHLLAWMAAVYTMMYLALLVDSTSVLRTKDGTEYPWIRPVANAIVTPLFAWLAAMTLWLEWQAMLAAIVAGIVGTIALGLTDASPVPTAWMPWSFGLGAQLCVVALLLRRSQRPGMRAWALFGGALVWLVGMPVVQALSWTLGQVADKAPHRQTSETLYLIVSGTGIILYGALAMVLWKPMPGDFDVRDARMAAPPATTSAALYVSEPIQVSSATSLRHRTAR